MSEAANESTTTQTVTRPRRRYIKVDVSEEVFVLVHDMANKSRMRLLPYLRRYLEECGPFTNPGDDPDSLTFESERTAPSA
jgi:hypothetical protein